MKSVKSLALPKKEEQALKEKLQFQFDKLKENNNHGNSGKSSTILRNENER